MFPRLAPILPKSTCPWAHWTELKFAWALHSLDYSFSVISNRPWLACYEPAIDPKGFTYGQLAQSWTWLSLICTDWKAIVNILFSPTPEDHLLTQCNFLVTRNKEWGLWLCCSLSRSGPTWPDYVNPQGMLHGLQILLMLLAKDDTLNGWVLLKG